jgi:hypothetical protein
MLLYASCFELEFAYMACNFFLGLCINKNYSLVDFHNNQEVINEKRFGKKFNFIPFLSF